MASDYDSPWKESIGLYLRQFLEFFFQDIHDDIDWSAGYEFWMPSFRPLPASPGTVTCLSGEAQLVLIHVEVQSQRFASYSACWTGF